MITPAGVPTDNLYKFLAIAGLLVGGAAGYTAIRVQSGFDERMVASQQSLGAGQAALREYQQGIARYHATKAERDKQVQDSLGRELDVLVRASDGDAQLLALYHARTRILLYAAIVVSLAGFIATIYGFDLWYKRLQKYQDKLVQLHAERTTHPRPPFE